MEHRVFHPANNPIIRAFGNSKFFNLDLTHEHDFVSQDRSAKPEVAALFLLPFSLPAFSN